MSNSNSHNKGVRMSLGAFHSYVTTKNASKTKKTTFSLADKMRRPANSARPVASSRDLKSRSSVTITRKDLPFKFTEEAFPPLTDVEIVSYVNGAWCHGIDSIIAAKDLPDPEIARKAQERRDRYERQQWRRSRNRREADYEDYSDDYEYAEDPLSEDENPVVPVPSRAPSKVVNVSKTDDEPNWEELL